MLRFISGETLQERKLPALAQLNPFHNGHAYHIAETRKRTGADYIIVVMSPDFVQRGEAALLDKWSRTRCALEAGADLVLQLPAWNAVGSAEYFAEGGVSLLSHLGICDLLSFGCETEFPELLRKAAAFFSMDTEPEPYREILRQKLKEGMTFPQARAEAFAILWGDRVYDRSMQKQFDVVLRSLRRTLAEYGIPWILEVRNGALRVCPDKISCDAWLLFNGSPEAMEAYCGGRDNHVTVAACFPS